MNFVLFRPWFYFFCFIVTSYLYVYSAIFGVIYTFLCVLKTLIVNCVVSLLCSKHFFFMKFCCEVRKHLKPQEGSGENFVGSLECKWTQTSQLHFVFILFNYRYGSQRETPKFSMTSFQERPMTELHSSSCPFCGKMKR